MGKYAQIRGGKESKFSRTLTVYYPVPLSLNVLTERYKLQVLLAEWIIGWGARFGGLCLFVLIMNHAIRPVEKPFDFRAERELQLHQLS